MLSVEGLTAGYGHAMILRDLSLTAEPGRITCLMGRNGAGKTTTLKAIMGLVAPETGRITLDGEVISDLAPHRVPGQGIGYIPQGRRLFGELTVQQNLRIGLMTRKSGPEVQDEVLTLFPACVNG
ncbi:ATP-binding cassette domain-containing protein [Pseudooceanicola sp. LIPI14-2-Ac024]|uniref:ATP-binding cassette domain-containing protein n=1 Tax=Pseudooceanicola sp. LIPI14-2-Ac024 TaxID=3344875 RepID=UPI0035D1298F